MHSWPSDPDSISADNHRCNCSHKATSAGLAFQLSGQLVPLQHERQPVAHDDHAPVGGEATRFCRHFDVFRSAVPWKKKTRATPRTLTSRDSTRAVSLLFLSRLRRTRPPARQRLLSSTSRIRNHVRSRARETEVEGEPRSDPLASSLSIVERHANTLVA